MDSTSPAPELKEGRRRSDVRSNQQRFVAGEACRKGRAGERACRDAQSDAPMGARITPLAARRGRPALPA